MRSEQEIFDLILSTAREDERIRAVVLNGSRANPNAPRDRFQDYDVVYLVRDVQPFVKNLEYIQRFGELMILEMPEDMDDPLPSNYGGFNYLMQFTDGNRIDLDFSPLERWTEITSDSLSVVLLDKDGQIGELPPSSEKDYLPRPPTQKAFDDCCTEFWWVSVNVAKGLWRDEILYARTMLEQYVRPELMTMLKWYIGLQTGFPVNPGKFGKYYRRYLEPGLWELLLRTCPDAGEVHCWEALFAMTELFRRAALALAGQFNLAYPQEVDRNVSAYLKNIRSLPRGKD